MFDRKNLHDFGIPNISNTDLVSIVALSQKILADHDATNIKTLAAKLDVPLMTEHANRFRLVNRILQPLRPPEKPENEKSATEPQCRTDAARILVSQIAARTGMLKKDRADNKTGTTPWLRSLCKDLMDKEKITEEEISAILDIPLYSVKKFKSASDDIARDLSEDEAFVMHAWNSASHAARKDLESFWYHLGHNYPGKNLSYDFVRQTTLNLGLRQHYTKQKNHGVTPMREFSPLSYWAADGKQLRVSVNDDSYAWSWYAFGCAGTSLFVGASITETENSQAFLEALKDARDNVDTFPIGVLVDNRLARERVYDLSKDDPADLPAEVLNFCKEHGIIIVHSWPGNPKCNIMENHFSVFAQHVREIKITGQTPKELSASVARAVTEAFMKVRNHTPRKRLRGKTPHSLTQGKRSNEADRPAILKLAERMNKKKVSK